MTIRTLVQRLWVFFESRNVRILAAALFRMLIRHRSGPVLLTENEVTWLRDSKTRNQARRLKQLGKKSVTELDAGRADLVSIGVFACNRFDLLQRTCASLGKYLEEYGGNFAHEVIFFHDGANDEIEAWARAQKFFDRVLVNPVNHGLSKNLNRFWFEESKGTYILDVEDDWLCEYQDDFIGNALDVLRGDEGIGCVNLSRRYPDDYRVWNSAFKIGARAYSAQVFATTKKEYAYRLLPQRSYGNSCSLCRFSSLALTGRIEDSPTRRRSQEGEYMQRYTRFWMGARGTEFKDSPFLHIGEGRSSPTWNS
jgi:hypothetical protein